MMRKIFIVSFFIGLNNFAFSQYSNENLGIIPAPKSVKKTVGEFTLNKETAIMYENAEDLKTAQLFHDFLKENYAIDLVIAKNFIQAPKSAVRFDGSNYSGKSEGYNLSIDKTQILLAGKGPGLFYGMQTLMQLLPLAKASLYKIPCAEIQDEPRYGYRGLHLDVGRHMFPVSFIKKYIDLIAQYKLNTFHWHLTEDQGWRIEIKRYPKLTQVGGYRDQTVLGHFHDRMPQYFDKTPYGGFYTQEEVKEIVAYATSKYITVIPEIEMPGHSLAALASYPELACGDNPGPFKVAQKWGIFEDIYCAGKENTFTFLQNVLSEVIELFPSTYIHIGGDEAPKTKWSKCKYCQKRIRDNKLKDEHELQSYFITRIEKFLNSKGRQIIGWDEILDGGLAPNATVMSWRGVQGGISAARQKHKAIMTPDTYLYLDHYQGNPVQEPLAIHGFTSLAKTYSYNPTPDNLPAEMHQYIAGVQANVWTEYIKTTDKIEYMLLPRLLALSEVAWTPIQRKNFKDFSENRVPDHLARLEQDGKNYRVPTAIGIADTTIITSEYTLNLTAPVKGAKIYYTLDEYTPNQTSLLYDKPVTIQIPIREERVLKTRVISSYGKESAVTTTILNNFEPMPPQPVSNLKPGLKYFYLPGRFELAANIDTGALKEIGTVSTINLNKGRGKARSYALVFNGYINVPEDGSYIFTALSDDGSQVVIDDKVVVNNDGKHTTFELSGATRLSKGYHKIQIRYFQIGGQSNLKVTWTPPGGKQPTEIPANLLFN